MADLNDKEIFGTSHEQEFKRQMNRSLALKKKNNEKIRRKGD